MLGISIDRSVGIPLYRQIQDYIRNKIESGDWGVGDQISTEQMLCDQFQVSRITVIRAINRLVEEGLVRKEQGKGTFVTTSPLMPEPLTLRSFTEEMQTRGLKPGTIVLSKAIEDPTPRLRERLLLSPNAQVWHFDRLLKADDTSVGIQRAYLPIDRFPTLGAELTDNVSLYNILSKSYGIEAESAIETYSSVLLDDEECALLTLPQGSSAFSVERLTFLQDKPIEFVKSLMRSDYFRYTVKLIRQVQR